MKNIKLLTIMLLLLSTTLFANAVATITAMKGDALIQRAGEELAATLGSKLEAKDKIVTRSNAKLQIIFKDDTIITVGKNSNFSIKDFIFEEGKEPVAKFAMLSGAMRTITGKIGKIAPDKFSVKTKTATIGIRGTNFTIVYTPDGSYNAYCTFGKISATVDGKVHIIKQGFFISISTTGKINIKEFTSKDLKVMKQNNFGGGKEKKAKADQAGDDATVIEGEKGAQLDNTREDVAEVVIQDVTSTTDSDIENKKVTDATTTITKSTADNIENHQVTEVTLPQLPAAITGIGIGENNSAIDLHFYFNNNAIDTTSSYALRYDFTDNQALFYSLKFAPTTNIKSLDTLSTSFVSAEPISQTGASTTGISSYESTPTLTSSSVISTNDDLVSGDYMAWGEWSVSGYNTYPYEGQISFTESGLWQAGEQTPSDVVNALTGNITYKGKYKALEFAQTQTTITGNADVNVNFGTNKAILTIDYNGGQQYNMTLSGNSLSGNNAKGLFYGPKGESIGGNFKEASSTQTTLRGVYQVTSTGN